MCSQNDQRDVGIILSHVCWGWTPPPQARQVGQPQPKPLSRHGDQGGGGGGWANGSPCHPPPRKAIFFPPNQNRGERGAFPLCSRVPDCPDSPTPFPGPTAPCPWLDRWVLSLTGVLHGHVHDALHAVQPHARRLPSLRRPRGLRRRGAGRLQQVPPLRVLCVQPVPRRQLPRDCLLGEGLWYAMIWRVHGAHATGACVRDPAPRAGPLVMQGRRRRGCCRKVRATARV